MKKIFILSFLVMFIIGCNKYNTPYNPNDIKQENSSFNNDYLYDEIYEIRDGKEIDLTHTQLETKALYKFSTITSFEPRLCYLGFVFNGATLNDNEINQVASSSVLKDSITVSYSLPIAPIKVGINKSETAKAINHAVHSKDFSGGQSYSFSYKMKNIRRYNQINIAFGAKVNIANLFDVDLDIKKGAIKENTCLMADMTQIYFSAYMDFPYDGNIFKTEELRKQYLQYNPVYIGAVNMGRKAVLLAETSVSYKELSVAIRAAFKAKKINGKLDLDSDTKDILKTTELQVCIIAPNQKEAYRTIYGFEAFEEYIVNCSAFSKEAYGMPISFSGTYASNNGLFNNNFNID